jgi:ATP synthase proteolipid subunit
MTQPFFGAMGCTSAIVFTCFGAAYGTAKSGVGISAMGVLRPDLIVKSMLLPSGCDGSEALEDEERS